MDADAEALRQMQEGSAPDRRGEGDGTWLANGAQVELQSLQKAAALNGQRGEIVGFDDKQPPGLEWGRGARHVGFRGV